MSEATSFIGLIVLIVVAFIIAFPIIWIVTVWLISLGGWAQLAQRYRAPLSLPPAASRHKWLGQYGFVNRARYGNALILTAHETGLLLETVPLFRINHPPLFIPWEAFHNASLVTFRHHELVQLEVGHPTVATIRIPYAFVEQNRLDKRIPTG